MISASRFPSPPHCLLRLLVQPDTLLLLPWLISQSTSYRGCTNPPRPSNQPTIHSLAALGSPSSDVSWRGPLLLSYPPRMFHTEAALPPLLRLCSPHLANDPPPSTLSRDPSSLSHFFPLPGIFRATPKIFPSFNRPFLFSDLTFPFLVKLSRIPPYLPLDIPSYSFSSRLTR